MPVDKKTSQAISWGFHCMCAGEWLDVEGELITMEKKHGMQWKVIATARGADSGWTYDIKSVENIHQIWMKGTNGTYTWTMTVSLNGAIVSTIHQRQHITQNANGEWTVMMLDGPTVECGE